MIVLKALILGCFISTTCACFGEKCPYSCHCLGGSPCDAETGFCSDGCDDGNPDWQNKKWKGRWYGEGCQIGNIALNKAAENHPDSWNNYDGMRAVDGNFNNALSGGSCAHPNGNSGVASWTIDLGAQYNIINITIYNRNEYQDRIKKTYVNVYQDSTSNVCGFIDNPSDLDIITVICDPPLTGNNVEIIRQEGSYQQETLNFCEVYIEGFLVLDCADGKYGPGCLRDCHCQEGKCTNDLGYCASNCDPGFKKGAYGACSLQCAEGFYGQNCSELCNCKNITEVCNHINGECSECPENYARKACDKQLPHYNLTPVVMEVTDSSVSVRFEAWSPLNGDGDGPVVAYLIEYTEKSDLNGWRNGLTLEVPSDTITMYEGTVDQLSSNTTYLFKVKAVVNYDGIEYMGQLAEYEETTDIAVVTSGGADAGAIAGGIVGILLIIMIVLLAIIFRRCIRKSNPKSTVQIVEQSQPITPTASTVLTVPPPVDKEVYDPDLSGYPNLDNVPHQIVPVSEYDVFVSDMRANPEKYSEEFKKLPSDKHAPWETAQMPENKRKDRFTNIRAYDHTRVKLPIKDKDPHSDYINASYIDGWQEEKFYVATQGPTPETVTDFWRMIWHLQANRIIMLTRVVVNSRQKCARYWPSDDSAETHGDFTVTHTSSEKYAYFTIRQFSLTCKGHRTGISNVRQFHYDAWPDKGVPEQPSALLSFYRKIRSFDKVSRGPWIVHCSAGIGRTGTLIALDYLLEKGKHEGSIDVLGCAYLLRAQRVNMVQTESQYKFLHDALVEGLLSADTCIPCSIYDEEYSKLDHPSTRDESKTRLQEQFASLKLVRPVVDENFTGLAKNNIEKNRDEEIIPRNSARAFLITPVDGGTDYINAVYVDGFKSKMAYIITQMPLPITTVDMWRLVLDHRCTSIITLHQMVPDENAAPYWPEGEEDPVMYGPIQIQLDNEDSSNKDITIREFTVHNTKLTKDPISVKQFHVKNWENGNDKPDSNSTILELFFLVQSWQQKSGNHPIIIQCLNGADKSGAYCAASYMIEKMRLDQEVDVYEAVKHVKLMRPQAIINIDQLQWMYDLAKHYRDTSSAYANFQ